MITLLTAFLLYAAIVQGHIHDSLGHEITGATVQLQSSGQPRTLQSDQAGFYRIPSLPGGTYTLRANATSTSVTVFGPFSLKANETKNIDLVLTPTPPVDFSDQPNFVVAGVTDGTYIGGHGSETRMRSAESLTKAATSLKKDSKANAPSESSVRAGLALDPNDAALHHSLAEIEEEIGKPLDAVREYQRAAELDPSEINFFDWGTELLVHSAPQAAIEVFGKGIYLFPQSSRMLLGAAVAFYAHGDYQEAAQRFIRATDLNPDNPHPYLFLAEAQMPELTNSGAYLDRLTRFLKLQPDNPWANYYYATALRNRAAGAAASAQAQALLEKATRLDPKLAAASLELGTLYFEKQDLLAAIDAYQDAIQANPTLEQAHYRLSTAYRAIGQLQKARQEAEIFQRLHQTSADQHQQQRSQLQRFIITLKNPAQNQ